VRSRHQCWRASCLTTTSSCYCCSTRPALMTTRHVASALRTECRGGAKQLLQSCGQAKSLAACPLCVQEVAAGCRTMRQLQSNPLTPGRHSMLPWSVSQQLCCNLLSAPCFWQPEVFCSLTAVS